MMVFNNQTSTHKRFINCGIKECQMSFVNTNAIYGLNDSISFRNPSIYNNFAFTGTKKKFILEKKRRDISL